MKMKKVLLVMLAPMLLMSCKVSHFHTEQAIAEEQRALRGFERIELLGSLDVEYTQADSFSVMVMAPDKVIDYVETRVEGNKLVVNMKGENKLINLGSADGGDVRVHVTSPDFLGIELRGSGDFECKNLLDTDNLDIVLKGSGDIDFYDIICDRVNVSLVGSGDVDVKNVQTQQSLVELVGSGDIKMRFTNSGSVTSQLTGSGDITLKGNVRNYNYNVRGSGDMHTKELIVKSDK